MPPDVCAGKSQPVVVALRFYNSLTQTVVPLETIEPGKVRLYVCGPTVYDDAHLGHARCYITWDILYRLLGFCGYDVVYVRNVTDVDDKILNRARERGDSPHALARRNYESFCADMKALNVLSPVHEPRATAYLPEIIVGIESLIVQGAAYVTPTGTVYYRVSSKADYGKLSRKPLQDLQSGARVDVDPHKESPLDFALWRGFDNETLTGGAGEHYYESPWGPGLPGWHMECSAMSLALLGEQLDIHAGGSDLVFPHHENEIAQSEAITGKTPFVRIWMHNGFVNVSGEKMSKSLGNFATIKTLLQAYDANTLRYFLLTHHYRMPVDFTDEALQAAKNRMVKWNRALSDAFATLGWDVRTAEGYLLDNAGRVDGGVLAEGLSALCDDLNTAKALSTVNGLVGELNTVQRQAEGACLDSLKETLVALLALLALLGFDWRSAALANQGLSPDLMALIEERAQAKATKNWAMADAIRAQLLAAGVQLKDNKDGTTTWERV